MKIASVLAMAGLFVLSGIALAQDANAPKRGHEGLMGKIVSVDANANQIVVVTKRGEGPKVTVTADDKTVVTVDDVAAKLSDLKPDMYVHVTPAEGTATKIAASTKMHARTKPS